MYKITNYYIAKDLENGEKLLYNTYNTAMITLDLKYYDEYFIKNNFDYDEKATKALKDLEFIVLDELNESERLKNLMKTGVYKKNDIQEITIAPTTLCNARCSYCFERNRDYTSMTKETQDALVSFIVKHCITQKLYISWFGGEPLLAKDVIDYICMQLINNGIELQGKITTNGLLINNEILKKAKKDWKVDRIQITFDGLFEKYDEIKNYYGSDNKGAFEKVLKNAELVLKSDFKLNLRINYDPFNMKETMETIDFFTKKFKQYHNFNIYAAPISANDIFWVSNEWKGEGEHPLLQIIKKMISLGYYSMHEIQDAEVGSDEVELMNYYKLFPCVLSCQAATISRFTVGPEGELYKCHRFLGDKKYTCGNVFDGIFYNDQFKYFCDQDYTFDKCPTCNLLPICQGGCRANKELFSDDHGCLITRSIIKEILEIFYNSQ